MSINSIRSILESAYEHCPDKVALIQNTKQLTYRELYTKVNKVAHYLRELNLPAGSRVGIYSDKRVGQVIAILALLSTEYIFVPISRLLKPEQVAYIIDDCNMQCIITDETKLQSIEQIPFQGDIITYETTESERPSFYEIYKYYSSELECRINAHNIAALTYYDNSIARSSGYPKGIAISHANLTDGARMVSSYLDVREEDVISAILPFNFDYGLNQIFTSIYKHATLSLHKLLLPGDFFTHLIRDRVTVLPLMPIDITNMFDEDVHRLPAPEQLQHIRVITSSGGKITDKMIEDISRYFQGAKFYSMHGLSEAFRSAYLDPAQIHIRPNSIGKAVPGVELFILNEKGEACKPREVGELIQRGACIYKGYWNSPEDTQKRFKSIAILEKVISLDGALTDEIVVASGDYVYKDEEEYIYFDSRKDDMIKTSGHRVNPLEIESVIKQHLPNIQECAIFGVADEKIEEQIVLVYSSESALAKNEIVFELKKHLANYMIPGEIIFRKSIPLKEGKADKELLKKEFF
jgi:acyl-CoA synthetase (AMP-forming)/AMP-acid ligase II